MKSNIKKYFSKQYMLLIFSIIFGILVIVLGSSYAIYVVTLTGDDSKKAVGIKIKNINLDVSNESGSLSLCKIYPIPTSEGLTCTPYQFTLTNNNDTDLFYYLNFELSSEVPKEAFRVAYAECSDSNCTNVTYVNKKLSEYEDNIDTELAQYSGKLLNTGATNFSKGTSKTYSVIFWIDEDYDKDASNFTDNNLTATITAITYTKNPNGSN